MSFSSYLMRFCQIWFHCLLNLHELENPAGHWSGGIAQFSASLLPFLSITHSLTVHCWKISSYPLCGLINDFDNLFAMSYHRKLDLILSKCKGYEVKLYIIFGTTNNWQDIIGFNQISVAHILEYKIKIFILILHSHQLLFFIKQNS